LYTKAIPTLIAALLAVSALRPLFQPSQTVQAQTPFNNIQFTGNGGDLLSIDTRTGDIWEYSPTRAAWQELQDHYKITKLGNPLLRLPRL
jgi:hypothetical protein